MISKKFYLSAILLVSINPAVHSELSNPALVEAYKGKDSEWKYMEYLFIEKPKTQLNSFAQKARAIILTLGASTILATKFENIKNVTFDASKLTSDLSVAFSTGILGLIGFETITNYMDASIKHDTLAKFLKDWDFHKQHIPVSLHPAFDELATAFNASESKTIKSEDVATIFELIQHLIEHEFSKRYEKDKKKDTDMLAVVKTVTEIGKNIK